jgi:hypothetical protein
VLEADDGAGHAGVIRHLDRALGDVLGEIANAFEIARDVDGGDKFAKVDSHRLPAGDGAHRLILDFALQPSRRGSLPSTFCASATSRFASASMASLSIFSAMPPISAILAPMRSSSAS